MTVEQVRNYALSIKGVTESIKWENHLCFSVGDKMFFVIVPDTFPVTGSFKASEDNFNLLIEKAGFIPAPYMAKYNWVHFDDINNLKDYDWKAFFNQAYELTLAKLSGKARKQILES